MKHNNLKRRFKIAFVTLAILTAGSCKIEYDQPIIHPMISFEYDTGYVSRDTTVNAGSIIKVGVRCKATELNNDLKKLTHILSRNGQADSTVETIDIPIAYGDRYGHDFSIKTDSKAGVEIHTFRVSNMKNVTSDISVIFSTR